jgi:hypothetical protein
MGTRVLYIHEGNARSLEDLSKGVVASYLRDRYTDFHVESMETVLTQQMQCERQQLQALHSFRPDIVVAKGGEMFRTLALQQWTGVPSSK